MRETILALAALIALTACATAQPPRYQKAGVSPAQRQRDEAECALAAVGTEKPQTPPLPVDRDVVDRGMAARGYSVRAGL